jgi:LmbE family N-acetylglucosaminyl deacetylase
MRSALASGVESVWTAGLKLAGTRSHPAAVRWSSPGGQRVLVVAPHPDDEASGCGGTLMLHVARGDEVCIAYITDGRRSRALGLSPDEMAQRRRHEAAAAAAALGVQRYEWLGLREGEWTLDQLVPRLRTLLSTTAPHIVYAPSRVDFHPEHLKIAHALAQALDDSQPRIRIYPMQVPLTALLANVVADVSGVAPGIIAALKAHETQLASTLRTLRMRRYAAAIHGCSGQAEEFRELSAPEYRRLHEAPPEQWRTRFRSLRQHPWTDPLAYLTGRRQRARLRSLAR